MTILLFSALISGRTYYLLHLLLVVNQIWGIDCVGSDFMLKRPAVETVLLTAPAPCTTTRPPSRSSAPGSAGPSPVWWSWSEWWWFAPSRTDRQHEVSNSQWKTLQVKSWLTCLCLTFATRPWSRHSCSSSLSIPEAQSGLKHAVSLQST